MDGYGIIGLERGQCTSKGLQRVSKVVPKSLEPYYIDMANISMPFQSSAVRPVDPSTARYQQLSTSQTTPSSSSMTTATVIDTMDAEIITSLSRQSSIGSHDHNSRKATYTPSVYSDDEDTDSVRSSTVDMG